MNTKNSPKAVERPEMLADKNDFGAQVKKTNKNKTHLSSTRKGRKDFLQKKKILYLVN